MADGFATNSDSMISNFEKIGQTIEDNLVKKVEGLDKLIKELPESVNSSVSEMVEDEKLRRNLHYKQSKRIPQESQR